MIENKTRKILKKKKSDKTVTLMYMVLIWQLRETPCTHFGSFMLGNQSVSFAQPVA
jgi:hypothetical protein